MGRRLALVLAALLLAGVPVAAEAGACRPGVLGARSLWALADVDGDQIVDLIRVSTAGAASRPEVMAGDCALTTASPRTAAGGMLTARDVDEDRDLDLVQVDATGSPVRTWLNDGTGRFRPAGPRSAPTPRQAPSITLTATSPLLAVAGALGPRERLAAPGPVRKAEAPTDASRATGMADEPIPALAVSRSGTARAPPGLPLPLPLVTS